MNGINIIDLGICLNAYIKSVSIGRIILVFVMCVIITSGLILTFRHRNKDICFWKAGCLFCFSLTFSVICVVTLTGRQFPSDIGWEWKFFQSYKEALEGRNASLMAQIIWNIFIFIPMGMFMPICFDTFKRYRYVLLSIFAMSCTIELIQGIGKLGLFEVDDIMNNLLGTVIGVGIYAMLKKLYVIIKGSIKDIK